MNELKDKDVKYFKEKMYCPKTEKMEKQIVIKESEDGITLKCLGCEKIYGKEIGYFAD